MVPDLSVRHLRRAFPTSIPAILAGGLLLAWISPRLSGQAGSTATDPLTETTNVVAVEVPVRVLLDGDPVRGLGPESFELLDGKKRREITGFEVVDLARLMAETPEGEPAEPAPPPITARRHFLLLFDLSYAQPASITRAREAVLGLIEEGLHPTDLVAVATYSGAGGVRLLHGFTSDRRQVSLAVQTLGLPQLVQPAPDPLGLVFGDLTDAVSSAGGGGVGSSAFVEALQDFSRQLQEADRRQAQEQIEDLTRSFGELADLLDATPGRKHILYLSEGFDTDALFGTTDRASQIRMNQAAQTGRIWEIDSEERFGSSRGQNLLENMLESFRRADCTFETIDIGGLRRSGGVEQGNRRAVERTRASRSGRSDALALIAAGTGGEFIRNFNNLSTALGEVMERTGVTYVLTFQPEDLEPDGSYHRLKVKLVDGPRGAEVVHRPGYFAPLPFASVRREERRLQSAARLLDGDEGGEIVTSTLAVAALPATPGGASPPTPLLLEISGPDLVRGRRGGNLQVEIFAYAIDREGAVRGHLDRSLQLDLDRTGEKLRASGLKLFTQLDLEPGHYDLRTLVRDGDGRWGLSTSDLWVPDFRSPGLLPPLMVEAPGSWLLVRDEPEAGAEAPPYPFVARGHTFLPAARPILAPGAAAAVAVTGFGFSALPESPDLRVLRRSDGAEAPARVQVVDRSLEAGGVIRYALTLDTRGLADGAYELEISASDPGGVTARTRFRFEVASGS